MSKDHEHSLLCWALTCSSVLEETSWAVSQRKTDDGTLAALRVEKQTVRGKGGKVLLAVALKPFSF